MMSGFEPLFDTPLPVGQLHFPDWERYETAMRGIFEREYYNNNGPLVRELEKSLEAFFGVKHTICVGNATFGLMMVADALKLTGKVLMPSFTFIASAQSLEWCGLTPVFCDIDADTHHISPTTVDRALKETPDISAILAVNLWGGSCDVQGLEAVSKSHGIPLYFDSAHAFGCAVNGQMISSFGSAEVFSFHATKVMSSAEGGCVTTNDDALAARLRGIRPSYDSGETIEPYRVLNSRMSEAQAAIGLMSLEDFPSIRQRNKSLFEAYRRNLRNVPGIQLVEPVNVSSSNHQYVTCTVDVAQFGLSRDDLLRVLAAENVIARRYFYPGIHRCAGFEQNATHDALELPMTEELCKSLIQLPLGARVSEADVQKICDLLVRAHAQAPELRQFISALARSTISTLA